VTEIWVPSSARPAYKCLVPGCGSEFLADEQAKFTRHVARCAARNRDALEELSAARPFAGTPFGEAIDPEAADYMRRQREKLRQ
jgi:hypothetical protein